MLSGYEIYANLRNLPTRNSQKELMSFANVWATQKIRSFPELVKPKRGETIMFSFIVFKSRAHRDRVNAKVMKDPRIINMMKRRKMPFDSKRMAYGGFEVMVDV